MRNTISVLVLLCLLSPVLAMAQVPVTGAEGVRLRDLAGTPTLVTVKLKERGATDANLNLIEVQSTYFKLMAEDGEQITYTYDMVAEVQVQGGKVEKRVFEVEKRLRPEDVKVVERAAQRIRELFGSANDNQEVKILTAALLALAKDQEAIQYLEMLTETNDLRIQLGACMALYLAGLDMPQQLLRLGLESGNRQHRAQAATIAGLVNYQEAIPAINGLAQDRATELSAPAIRALANMGHREAIPRMLSMLGALSKEKADAAIYGLSKLGGEDVIEALKTRLNEADGLERFRIIVVLHRLGDPLGRQLLLETFGDVPTLKTQVARVLAEEGDWESSQFLSARLSRRINETETNMLERARTAAALLAGGDAHAMAVLQRLLNEGEVSVRIEVCKLIVAVNDPKLLAIIQSSIENVDSDVALAACLTAFSLADQDFRQRLIDWRSSI